MTWLETLRTEPPRVMTLRQAADYINGAPAEPGTTRAISPDTLRAECVAGRLVGNKIARDLTACRAELASIAILMQERDQLPDLGGVNYALVAGAVTTYVLAMELAVVALNEDRQQLLEQIGGLNNLLACDDDCYHAPMCVRWEHGDDVFDDDCKFTLRDETGAPMIVSEGVKWPNDPNITRRSLVSAERQRAYRERKGARVGGKPGPTPSAPCGTPSAYKRHKRNGEPIDDACRLAYNAEQRRLYALRKR